MFIGFKVGNFRSFNDIQHFSMIPGSVRLKENHCLEKNKLKLLKFAALYGANASGKSNLILAIQLGKKLIFSGVDLLIENQYNRNFLENKEKNSYFEYEILCEDKMYSYGFEINILKKEIISEWLLDMTNLNKPKKIFERDVLKNSIITDLKFFNKIDSSRFESCKHDMENNNKIFFISEIIRRIRMSNETSLGFQDFLNIYNFFEKKLQIVLPNHNRIMNSNYFIKYKDDIKKLLTNLGININEIYEYETDISDIREKMSKEQYDILVNNITELEKTNTNYNIVVRVLNCLYTISKNSENKSIKSIKFKHKSSEALFDTYEESDGTIRILELIDILLSDNRVYFVDELERSLHPALSYKFIECFLNETNQKNIQLIITTHESRLLDFNLLRRDEIWFSKIDSNGSTKLYSLEQFEEKVRFDRKIDKAYLDGRFGAVPIFDNLEVSDESTD